MIRRVTVLTATFALGTMFAACGLPTDDDFQSIDRSQDGFGLWETSTTSTTTTLAPTTTVDVTTSSTIGLTTTTLPQTALVPIYFPTGSQLTPILMPLAINPALPQVMAALQGGPSPDLAQGIRLILPAEPPIVPTKSRGVVSVDFPEGMFDEMDPLDQRLVFGQIVLTLAGQPGVGQVRFTLAGQPMRVFKGNGLTTDPQQAETVSLEDYTILIEGSPIETTTTVTPSTPPPDQGTTVVPGG